MATVYLTSELLIMEVHQTYLQKLWIKLDLNIYM